MFKKFKITCDEVTTICDKNQYGEATFWDKVKLNIHFLRCKICPVYTKQNVLLTVFYKSYSENCKKVHHCLTIEEKEELKREFNKVNTQQF
ncbi:MAG: hypothetical protein WAO74_04690 [Polaribacter sp.]|uniref:hypothetical protein n=1 Tax=Polaribacter sp. TaxID=1920175 RepID=UPI003BB17B91